MCGIFDAGNKLIHDLEPMKYPHVSKEKVRLSLFVDMDGTARYWLVKLHGCLMIIAWMMCCTTAILLAKYYKPMWPNDELCGTDVWFSVSQHAVEFCLLVSHHQTADRQRLDSHVCLISRFLRCCVDLTRLRLRSCMVPFD